MIKKGTEIATQEVVKMEKAFLPDLPLVPLADIALIKRSPPWIPGQAAGGKSFQLVTCDDLPLAGFIRAASQQVCPDEAAHDPTHFCLQAYDFLIAIHHQTVKMGIVYKEVEPGVLPDKDIIIVRFKTDVRENALSLYAFLKTELGEKILESIKTKAKKHLPLISVTLFSQILVPVLNENIIKEAAKAFEVEGKFYAKIADIQMVVEGIFIDYLNKIQEKNQL